MTISVDPDAIRLSIMKQAERDFKGEVYRRTLVEPEYKISPPKQFTFQNVMYWEPKSKELLSRKNSGETEAATLLTKAKKFIEAECIVQIEPTVWTIKPLEGYNKTTYEVCEVDKEFTCNCQGFSMNKFCSHCLAVIQDKFIKSKHD